MSATSKGDANSVTTKEANHFGEAADSAGERSRATGEEKALKVVIKAHGRQQCETKL